MVLVCGNKNSVHYYRSKIDIINEMEKDNYDFDVWCIRCPANWIDVPQHFIKNEKLKIENEKLKIENEKLKIENENYKRNWFWFWFQN